MPTYEYKCSQCQHQFETIQKITEDPLKDCPKCFKPKLKKLFFSTNFQLKGKGWYRTDYK